MLLKAYGRSLLLYKIYQVSFPRDIYRRSGALLNKTSIIGKSYLRSDSRCYSLIIKQPVMKVCLLNTPTYCLSSHQEHRAFCLRCLSELDRKPTGSCPLLSTAVIAINQARLNFYRFSPFQGILRAVYKVTVVLI